MHEITITIQTEKAPEILLGQPLLGGKVTALALATKKLMTVAELMKKYNYSRPTIINKLAMINEGTGGKHLYDPEKADALLKDVKRGVGRGRKH